MKRFRAFLLFLCLSIVLSGCTARQVIAPQPEAAADKNMLQIQIDSSMAGVFQNELLPMFKNSHGSFEIECSFVPSNTIPEKFNNGMRTDLVIALSEQQMQQLCASSFIDAETVVAVAMNSLALISLTEGTTTLKDFSNLTNAKSIAAGNAETVSSGVYAQQLLEHYGLVAGENADTVVYANSAVDIVNWVAQKNCEVGLCFITDAHSSNLVSVLAEPPAELLNEKILYFGGISTLSQNEQAAKKFMDFITSEEALQVFEKYGFRAPSTIEIDT